MAISLSIPHERLTRAISRFGASALEARQVSRRLAQLLPQRLREIRGEYQRAARVQRPDQRQPGGVARAERIALTDPRYLEHLNELVDLHSQARTARVEYETHLMLLEARRSLRALRAAGLRELSIISANRS